MSERKVDHLREIQTGRNEKGLSLVPPYLFPKLLKKWPNYSFPEGASVHFYRTGFLNSLHEEKRGTALCCSPQKQGLGLAQRWPLSMPIRLRLEHLCCPDYSLVIQ